MTILCINYMDLDLSKIFSYSFSVIAIVISISTIIITKRNLRKQLRLGKLEEMLEILHYLNGYYGSMFRVFAGIEKALESLMTSNEVSTEMTETFKYRKGFLEIIDKETITTKISRLVVLSNAYLDNSNTNNGLKVRIHTIADVYYHMYMFIFMDGDASVIIKNKDAIIPIPDEMHSFMDRIESEIIIEMNLGYKSIEPQVASNYFKTQFESDLKKNKRPAANTRYSQ
jgi:hypothetical protein